MKKVPDPAGQKSSDPNPHSGKNEKNGRHIKSGNGVREEKKPVLLKEFAISL